MLTHEENELLCRVGPATPMGKLVRRFWIPASSSADVAGPPSPENPRVPQLPAKVEITPVDVIRRTHRLPSEASRVPSGIARTRCGVQAFPWFGRNVVISLGRYVGVSSVPSPTRSRPSRWP